MSHLPPPPTQFTLSVGPCDQQESSYTVWSYSTLLPSSLSPFVNPHVPGLYHPFPSQVSAHKTIHYPSSSIQTRSILSARQNHTNKKKERGGKKRLTCNLTIQETEAEEFWVQSWDRLYSKTVMSEKKSGEEEGRKEERGESSALQI